MIVSEVVSLLKRDHLRFLLGFLVLSPSWSSRSGFAPLVFDSFMCNGETDGVSVWQRTESSRFILSGLSFLYIYLCAILYALIIRVVFACAFSTLFID